VPVSIAMDDERIRLETVEAIEIAAATHPRFRIAK
jgi:hypothetical protein